MGWEPIDAEYESQMEAIYNGVLDEYLKSDSYHEDINRAIDDFTTDRQKAFYLKEPTVTEPAFNLLAEAKELFETQPLWSGASDGWGGCRGSVRRCPLETDGLRFGP
jgi:hypothetical protein